MAAPRGKLDKENLIKIGKGAGIAMGGALCVYLLEVIPNIEFGSYTPLVVGLASIVINFVRETLKDNE